MYIYMSMMAVTNEAKSNQHGGREARTEHRLLKLRKLVSIRVNSSKTHLHVV